MQSYLGTMRAHTAESLSHSDQVGHRFSLHLVHDMTALNFNGGLTRPQFSSNLLVEFACDHQAHDWAFARRERLETLPPCRNFRTLSAHSTVAIKCLLNRV